MARVVKVFGTLRNHWKKSTVAACALSYGGHWLYGKHWCVAFSFRLNGMVVRSSTDHHEYH